MAKKTTDTYAEINNLILQSLERGVVPWHQPWAAGTGAWPISASSGKHYRGINVWLLRMRAMQQAFNSPYWVTYKQAQALGGQVRKGERGAMAVFWKVWTPKDDLKLPKDEQRKLPVLRKFVVFNADQCDGLGDKYKGEVEPVKNEIERVEACEKIVDGFAGGPPIRHGGGRAYYSEGSDHVQMPERSAFISAEGYYHTLFHELVHSTKHLSRLNRSFKGGECFGQAGYSKEELVAEFGASFLCGVAGIDPSVEQSASYIDNWHQVLQKNPKWLVSAAGHAQRAADYVQGLQVGDHEAVKPAEAAAA